MGKKLLIIIIAAVIAVGAVGVGVGVGIFLNRPQAVMQTTVKNVLEDAFERQEFDVVTNLLESGSMEIILAASNGEHEVSLEYKEYFGLKKYETYIEKLQFSADDFSVSGSMYVGEDYMYVSVPSICEDPLGIVRGKTEKEFAGSIFAFDSDSDYELEEKTSDAIKVLCRIYDEEQDKNLIKDVTEIVESYTELIVKSVSEHADIEKESSTVKIHGEEVGARIIKIDIDSECAYNVLDELHRELKKDSRIPKLIKKYGKLIDKYVEGTSLEGFVQSELGEDEDEKVLDVILEKYDEFIDDMRETLDDMEESLDEADGSKLRIKMVTKKTSSDLMALSVEAREGSDKQDIFELQIGKAGIKKTDKLTASVMGEELFSFEVKQNDRDGYKAELTLSESGYSEVSYFVNIDKAGSDFEIGMKNEYTYESGETETEKYAVEGDYSKSGKKHTFEFKDVVYTDASGEKQSLIGDFLQAAEDENVELEVKLIICENEKPKPLSKGKVKSILTLTEDDFEDFKTAAEELVEEFKNTVGGAQAEIPDIEG